MVHPFFYTTYNPHLTKNTNIWLGLLNNPALFSGVLLLKKEGFFYRTFKDASPTKAKMTATIQNRMTMVGSDNPFFSK
jgi:hypothetical protein